MQKHAETCNDKGEVLLSKGTGLQVLRLSLFESSGNNEKQLILLLGNYLLPLDNYPAYSPFGSTSGPTDLKQVLKHTQAKNVAKMPMSSRLEKILKRTKMRYRRNTSSCRSCCTQNAPVGSGPSCTPTRRQWCAPSDGVCPKTAAFLQHCA